MYTVGRPRIDRRGEAPPTGDALDPLEVIRRTTAAARSAEVARTAAAQSTPSSSGVAIRGWSIAGSANRLMLVLGILLLVAIAALWFLAGGAMRRLVVDVGQSTGVMSGVPAQTTRGIDAYRSGDLAGAERELDEAARRYPRSALALLYLARIRFDSNDPDGAGPLLEEAVARAPDDALAHRMLGEYRLTRAMRGLAGEQNRVFTASEVAAAEAELARAKALDPTDVRARGFHACALAMEGLVEEAGAELASAGAGPWDSCARGGAGVHRWPRAPRGSLGGH